jgi:hypothetical protein
MRIITSIDYLSPETIMTEKLYWFTSPLGRIELNMTMEQAKSCAHSGRCDDDVKALMEDAAIRFQLNQIDPEELRKELPEMGEWDDLSDHETNLMRILWMAAWDIVENEDDYED